MMMPSREVEHLKLLAVDSEDLAVVSAHLQDAIVKTGDLTYLPDCRRFAFLARRFDWESPNGQPRRRLTGLQFENVVGCRSRGIDRERLDAPLELLAITFEEQDAPSGAVRLVFAGGASVELKVECVEVCLKDLGPVWACERRPVHDLEST